MDAPVEQPPFAWQPFTPRGVAAFAQAAMGRLLLVQFVVALLTSGIVVWLAYTVWFPVISAAISQMPSAGQIRAGALAWGGDDPARLAEGRFLGFTVDLKHQAGVRLPAHIQVEFGRNDFRVFSLFGFWRGAYPNSLNFPFNRPELTPWWGAWSPAILAILGLGTLASLLVVWSILASVYSAPIWLIAFFSDRNLGFGGSWRLAGAALMPGALLMALAIFFYGTGTLGLVELFVAFSIHWPLTWIYAGLGALKAPRRPVVSASKGNPFA